MTEFRVESRERIAMLDITSDIAKAVESSRVSEGAVVVYIPHTTAAVTVNEGADPDVKRDILSRLDKLAPFGERYLHTEGNSDAHIKASLIGSSLTIPISSGKLALGVWQRIFFCEFDGPRSRKALVSIIPTI